MRKLVKPLFAEIKTSHKLTCHECGAVVYRWIKVKKPSCAQCVYAKK